jgi:hypothetical protein
MWLVNIFSLMHVRKDNFREKKVKSVLGKYFQFPNLYLGVLTFENQKLVCYLFLITIFYFLFFIFIIQSFI